MGRFLILLAIFTVAASVATAGRFRFPLKEGSRADVFYQSLQLAGIVLATAVELALPTATNWVGLPVLSYMAAALHLTSLAVYRVKLPAIQGIRPGTVGSHSADEHDIRRTRWPHQTIFAVAHVTLLIYLFTIFRYFF
jgi:hypothetical protein